MNNIAPSKRDFSFQEAFKGKCAIKLSAVENAYFTQPAHTFWISPTFYPFGSDISKTTLLHGLQGHRQHNPHWQHFP